jgi:hypothetical protein
MQKNIWGDWMKKIKPPNPDRSADNEKMKLIET